MPSIFIGHAAVVEFQKCLMTYLGEVGEGKVYAITPQKDKILGMIPLTMCAVERLAQEASRNSDLYSLIIIEMKAETVIFKPSTPMLTRSD